MLKRCIIRLIGLGVVVFYRSEIKYFYICVCMEEIFVFRLIKLKLLLINIYDYFLIIRNGFVIFVFINLEFLMKGRCI